MGLYESKEEEKVSVDFLLKYKLKERNYNHSYFGVIDIYQSLKDSDKFAFKKPFDSIWINEAQRRAYEKRIGVIHSNLLRVIEINTVQDLLVDLCAEYPGDRSLKDVIEFQKTPFKETLVWQITHDVVSICYALQKLMLNHGDLRPETLFANSFKIKAIVTKHIIIYYISFLSNQESNALHLPNGFDRYFKNRERTYLSPELLSALTHGIQPNHNWFKSDVYSLGITLLEVCTRKSSQDCYNYSQYTVIDSLIKERIAQVALQYSPSVVALLKLMLLKQQEIRPSFYDLHVIMHDIKPKILHQDPINDELINYIESYLEDKQYPEDQIEWDAKQDKQASKNYQTKPKKVKSTETSKPLINNEVTTVNSNILRSQNTQFVEGITTQPSIRQSNVMQIQVPSRLPSQYQQQQQPFIYASSPMIVSPISARQSKLSRNNYYLSQSAQLNRFPSPFNQQGQQQYYAQQAIRLTPSYQAPSPSLDHRVQRALVVSQDLLNRHTLQQEV